MSNVHNFQTSIICQVLHATLRVSEGSTIPTIELIAICDAFWKIVTFLALAIHIVSHSFMLGGIHPWQRHEECIIRAPSLEKIFLWCYHCSADEWLELCTATKLISPDPMLLIWRSDLNLNIFMCMVLSCSYTYSVNIPYGQSSAKLSVIQSFRSFRSFGSFQLIWAIRVIRLIRDNWVIRDIWVIWVFQVFWSILSSIFQHFYDDAHWGTTLGFTGLLRRQ